MKRRTFLTTITAAAACRHLHAARTPPPIIDTHIHLYDPSRPQGVAWPPKSNALIYKPTLPSRLRHVTSGLGVAGAIHVECSPWFEDNQWVLDVAAGDTMLVGVIGNLDPDKPDFGSHLERFAKNPLFLGIRYGYLWDRDFGKAISGPGFIDGLKMLSKANLVLDTANPSTRLLGDVIRLSDKVPDLRVVIDHLPALYPPTEAGGRREYDRCLRELHGRRNVHAKLSAVLRMAGNQKVSYELSAHKDRLDLLYETFGPDRVLFGSDWPNSDPSAPYTAVLAIVREYFDGKGRDAAEKYFWRNSAGTYRWKRREKGQPDAGPASTP